MAPPAGEAFLLAVYLGGELLIDGHECFPLHFRVVIPQVGGTPAVTGDAVEGQRQGGGDPQAALDEDEGDQPVGGAVHLARRASSSTCCMTCSATWRGRALPACGAAG